MKKWLKRIRGAVGMGLTWAAAWFGAGAIFGLVAGIYTAVWGTGTGLIFGSALSALVIAPWVDDEEVSLEVFQQFCGVNMERESDVPRPIGIRKDQGGH